MKKFIAVFILLLLSRAALSQQDPQFSQYMHNKLFINPAYAGMRKAICFSGMVRNQWNGFNGAPNTGVFSADVVIEKLHGGAGVNLVWDKLGFETTTGYRLNYAFHYEIKPGSKLGIGVEAGGYTKRIGPATDEQWVATTAWQSDAAIPPRMVKTVFDLGLGLWYEGTKCWFGISSTHLNRQKIDDGISTAGNVPHNLIYQVARHYFITGGCSLNAGSSWKLRPSFIVKSDITITAFDLNVTAVYQDRFWLGASYRLSDAFCPMFGLTVPKFNKLVQGELKMGFAYDYTLSALSKTNIGTFELFINYCIPLHSVPSGHGDPRIFD
ncbi:MAG TPA: type IX secretion system membrane protein PorP/SprF [Bacteroidia bacterium]|nr:type IX secretion system membrane protein PorP/SprF [Bacteroidia bacterium]